MIDAAVDGAITGMITSNKPVAEAMQQVQVNAATDVTGFGLKGHTTNMAALSSVDIVINQLPVIRGTPVLQIFCLSTFLLVSKRNRVGS